MYMNTVRDAMGGTDTVYSNFVTSFKRSKSMVRPHMCLSMRSTMNDKCRSYYAIHPLSRPFYPIQRA